MWTATRFVWVATQFVWAATQFVWAATQLCCVGYHPIMLCALPPNYVVCIATQLCCVHCHPIFDNFPFIFSWELPHLPGVLVTQGSCDFFSLSKSRHSTLILFFESLLNHSYTMLRRLPEIISPFTFHSCFQWNCPILLV